jgi:hypothetical protein
LECSFFLRRDLLLYLPRFSVFREGDQRKWKYWVDLTNFSRISSRGSSRFTLFPPQPNTSIFVGHPRERRSLCVSSSRGRVYKNTLECSFFLRRDLLLYLPRYGADAAPPKDSKDSIPNSCLNTCCCSLLTAAAADGTWARL